MSDRNDAHGREGQIKPCAVSFFNIGCKHTFTGKQLKRDLEKTIAFYSTTETSAIAKTPFTVLTCLNWQVVS